MKPLKIVLFILFLPLTNTISAQANDVIEDIQGDLKKCEFSFRKDFFKDMVQCLNHARGVTFKERVQAGLAMAMCTKADITKIPECINKLSEYVLNLEDARYRNLVTCVPIIQIETFQDLVDFDDDAVVSVCQRELGDNPDEIVKELTKHDLVEYFFKQGLFILVSNDQFFYSIKELEIYFRYIKALYEEEN